MQKFQILKVKYLEQNQIMSGKINFWSSKKFELYYALQYCWFSTHVLTWERVCAVVVVQCCQCIGLGNGQCATIELGP